MFHEKKIKIALTTDEAKIVMRAMVELRNWAIRENVPTEDIDRIILKLNR